MTAVGVACGAMLTLRPALPTATKDPKLRNALESRRVRALTGREHEILRLIASAKSNREIADILSIKRGTVRSHRTAIARKLGISSVAELTYYAIEHRVVRG